MCLHRLADGTDVVAPGGLEADQREVRTLAGVIDETHLVAYKPSGIVPW